MKALTKLFALIAVAVMAITFTSCGEDFDYNPQLSNRTIYNVESYTINDDGDLDNVEGYDNYNRSAYDSANETLRAYYEYYLENLTLLVWDNGKYEVNQFSLRETTDPQKPTTKDGKKQIKFKRTKHNDTFEDKGYYFGTIKLVEVGHNRYDCEIYDDEYNITFSATIQLDEGTR